jgi:hypothetical protein
MRLWQWGCENGVVDCPPFGSTSSSFNDPQNSISISSTTRGSWSAKALFVGRVALQQPGLRVRLGADATELYVGFGLRVAGLGLYVLEVVDDTGVTHLTVAVSSAGTIQVYRGIGTTLLGTAAAFSTGVYQYVEFHFVISDTVGVVQIKQDGRLTLDLSNQDTRNAGSASARSIRFEVNSSTSGTDAYFDDMAINDTDNSDGAGNNSWTGDVAIIGLVPTAVGDAAQLTRGGTDSGANWSQVEEIPPNGDTDYVYGATVNNRDLYNLADLDSTFADIQAVSFIMSAKKDNAGAGNIAAAVKQGATEVTLSDLPVPSGAYKALGEIKSKDPTDSTAWTRSKVNSLQAGPKVR